MAYKPPSLKRWELPEDSIINTPMFDHKTALVNPVFRLYWAGWESDTLTLAQNGWTFAQKQDIESFHIRLALCHREMKIYGVTEPLDLAARVGLNYIDYNTNAFDRIREIVLKTRLCIALTVNHTTREDFYENFQPMDPISRLVTVDMGSELARRPFIFQPLLPKNEIYIPDGTETQELLSKILEIQGAEQIDIRERKRKREARQNFRDRDINNIKSVEAQIVTLVA